MSHEIEFVKLEEELSEVILQIKITRYPETKGKIKFDVLKVPISYGEERCLKQFINDKILKDDWDRKISKGEIEAYRNKLNK